MIDIYLDDLSLEYVRSVSTEENVLLAFSNKDKDETLKLAVNVTELTYIYRQIGMRLETLGLKKEGE